jgi:hypothetical protein
MVDLALLQSVSYIAGALGVCVAATYYVVMLRNAENARRKDLVFHRLQIPHEFYKAYYELLYARDITSYEALREKWFNKTEEMSRLAYVLNHYNSLGVLIQEGLATPQQIFKQYLPIGVIILWERFRGEMVNARYRHKPRLEVHNPDAYAGFELLYREAKRLYPNTPNTSDYTREDFQRDAREMDELLKSMDAQ